MTTDTEVFYMRPIGPDPTRLRDDHNTAGEIFSSWKPTDLIKCDGVFIAPENLFNAKKEQYQMIGDRWGKVIEINGKKTLPSTWMAIIVDPPAPPVPFEWPATCEVKMGDGQKALYGFLHRID
jgi:hypothetical protein